ncbi:hypothetical protein WJ972_30230 [Achromobacter insuavis]
MNGQKAAHIRVDGARVAPGRLEPGDVGLRHLVAQFIAEIIVLVVHGLRQRGVDLWRNQRGRQGQPQAPAAVAGTRVQWNRDGRERLPVVLDVNGVHGVRGNALVERERTRLQQPLDFADQGLVLLAQHGGKGPVRFVDVHQVDLQ